MSEVTTIIVAARLVDGHRDVPIVHDAGVAIAGGTIAEAGTAEVLRARYPGAMVLEHPGATLLPGFIDGHCHLTQPGDGTSYEHAARSSVAQRHRRATANARRHLRAGVTTLRDLGSHADLFEWRASVSGPLPRLVLYGRPLTRPGGHMHLFGGAGEGPEGIARVARENLAMGSDGLKVVASGGTTLGTAPHLADLSTEEMAAAAAVAHEVDRIVTAHALPVEAMRRALEAGLDGIEHLAFLTGEGRSEFDAGLAERLVGAGMTFGSTLAINRDYIALAEADVAPDYELEEQRGRTGYYLENARQLHRLGARIVAATDAGWKYTPFGAFTKELASLAAAGLSEREVIHAATAGAAEWLRLGSIGRLAEGHAADMLIVDGDPTRDLGALDALRRLFVAGVPVPLESLPA